MSFFIFAGLRITSDVLIGKSTWDALFQPPNFFSKYKYMISPFFVCLNVTLSLSFSGLYHKLNVRLKVDAIKICFGSVVFYWWSVCVGNTFFKYSRWKKQIQQFICEAKILNQIFGCFPWHQTFDFFRNSTSKVTTDFISFFIKLILICWEEKILKMIKDTCKIILIIGPFQFWCHFVWCSVLFCGNFFLTIFFFNNS